jgi:hypothetical protein
MKILRIFFILKKNIFHFSKARAAVGGSKKPVSDHLGVIRCKIFFGSQAKLDSWIRMPGRNEDKVDSMGKSRLRV